MVKIHLLTVVGVMTFVFLVFSDQERETIPKPNNDPSPIFLTKMVIIVQVPSQDAPRDSGPMGAQLSMRA